MGQGLSFDLTQEEIEDLQKGCNFTFSQTDIQVLYKRFLKLDKDKKGFISNEEFLSIPEFKLNPLAQRLVTIFENVNFKDFLHLLSAFSPKAAKEDKLKFMFNFHDVDGDGYISRLDLEHIMRQVRLKKNCSFLPSPFSPSSSSLTPWMFIFFSLRGGH